MRRWAQSLIPISVLLLPSIAGGADQHSNRLTPSDIFRLQYTTDPQISPDGKNVAYVRQSANVMNDNRETNLWIVNFDGTDNRPLTTGSGRSSSPRWSPDGTRLAYLSDLEGRTQIYVRWMDTGQTVRITDLETAPSGISWSPDGKQIAFSAHVLTAAPHLANLPPAPAGAKWAEQPRMFNDLIYRFNGQGYLKPSTTQIFVVPADGGAPRQVSRADITGLYSIPYGYAPSGEPGLIWSSDRGSLIFSANLHPDQQFDPYDTEVYEISIADGSVKPLTHRKGPDLEPALSPDGKLIAYTGFDDRYVGHQTTYLYVMNRDGSNPRIVTSALDRDAAVPRWAPDGGGLYFMYSDLGDTKFAFTTLNGATRVIAEHLGNGGNAGSGGSAFSVGAQGQYAITFTQPQDPGGIAAGTIGRGELHTVVAPNSGLIEEKPLGPVEELWFNSSKDQLKIQSWVMKPPDFDPSKKYPLILEIHGGPYSDYGDRFDYEKQIYAAMGFIVVYVNPRGSTSYGEKFGNLTDHAYPGDDFYDLNSAVDAVIAKGYVDTDNLFVTGGSGGGVLTCWVIENTNRFRAAASDYPVVNWYSWLLTADIPTMASKYWFSGPPWEHPDEYINRSPLNHIKDVKTPTMLMAGEDDYRVPISEAEQYYVALKMLKVEALLVRFPGEPHGLSLRPSHQMTKVMYIASWFEQHKKG